MHKSRDVFERRGRNGNNEKSVWNKCTHIVQKTYDGNKEKTYSPTNLGQSCTLSATPNHKQILTEGQREALRNSLAQSFAKMFMFFFSFLCWLVCFLLLSKPVVFVFLLCKNLTGTLGSFLEHTLIEHHPTVDTNIQGIEEKTILFS